jgi:hypothetical protein
MGLLRITTAWLVGWPILCKGKGVQPTGEAPVSLPQMTHQTILPPENLSTWYFAIRWARFSLENQTAQAEREGFSTDYNNEVIRQLLTIEDTLQADWDAYMESITQNQPEVASHV